MYFKVTVRELQLLFFKKRLNFSVAPTGFFTQKPPASILLYFVLYCYILEWRHVGVNLLTLSEGIKKTLQLRYCFGNFFPPSCPNSMLPLFYGLVCLWQYQICISFFYAFCNKNAWNKKKCFCVVSQSATTFYLSDYLAICRFVFSGTRNFGEHGTYWLTFLLILFIIIFNILHFFGC